MIEICEYNSVGDLTVFIDNNANGWTYNHASFAGIDFFISISDLSQVSLSGMVNSDVVIGGEINE